MWNPICNNPRPPVLVIGERAWCTHESMNLDFLDESKHEPAFVVVLDALYKPATFGNDNGWGYLVMLGERPQWLCASWFWSEEQLATVEARARGDAAVN